MKSQPPLSSARGFSLIELIIIIVVMAIAAAGVITMNTGIFSGQADNTRMEVSNALMQECAELILSKGFNATSSLCSGVTVSVAGTTYGPPTVTLSSGNSGSTGMAACPYSTGTNCKLATIQLITPAITLLLVNTEF